MAIEDGRKFDGPVELVKYHQQKADGLFVRLTKPIFRRPGVQPRGYRFISHADMQKAMKDAARQLGYEVSACVCAYVCGVCVCGECVSVCLCSHVPLA